VFDPSRTEFHVGQRLANTGPGSVDQAKTGEENLSGVHRKRGMDSRSEVVGRLIRASACRARSRRTRASSAATSRVAGIPRASLMPTRWRRQAPLWWRLR